MRLTGNSLWDKIFLRKKVMKIRLFYTHEKSAYFNKKWSKRHRCAWC
jgi:hypothetical protein